MPCWIVLTEKRASYSFCKKKLREMFHFFGLILVIILAQKGEFTFSSALKFIFTPYNFVQLKFLRRYQNAMNDMVNLALHVKEVRIKIS